MRRLLAVVCAALVMISFLGIVDASESAHNTKEADIALCKKRAELFLDSIDYSTNVSDPILLDNLYGEVEAVAFSIDTGGYIIVNSNDFSVPELSLSGCNPFANCSSPVYNGPLAYYSKQNGTIISLVDGLAIDINQFSYKYKRGKIENPVLYVSSLEKESEEKDKSRSSSHYLTGTLQTWTISGGNCGSIASAICMRYYYDYVSTNYVDASNTSMNSLITLMQIYVGTGGTYYYQLVNGLNNYFNDRGVSNTAYKGSPYSFSRVKSSINANRPIIVGTSNHPTFGNHWIIAHGYYQGDYSNDYIIVNNGWGSNSVWVQSSTTYFDGTVYFYN